MVKIEGMDELLIDLDNLGTLGRRVNTKALKSGAKIVLARQKAYAPKRTGKGANALTVSSTKKFKSGNGYVKIGITHDNWKDAKGLYFQNFNGSRSSGQYVGWVDNAFVDSIDHAKSVMFEVLNQELDKILK